MAISSLFFNCKKYLCSNLQGEHQEAQILIKINFLSFEMSSNSSVLSEKRSIPLIKLDKIILNNNFDFISLQKDSGLEQIKNNYKNRSSRSRN